MRGGQGHERLAVLVGGHIDERRFTDAQEGLRPRNDLTEFARRFGADFVHFGNLNERVGRLGRTFARLVERRAGESAAVAFSALWSRPRFSVIYATGEDVGLPFAAVRRVTPWRRERIIVRVENPVYGRTNRRRRVYAAAMRFALDRMDLVLCRSEAHASLLRDWTKKSPHRIVVHGQETDLKFFDPNHATLDAPVPGIDLRRPIVVSAGLEMRDYATLVAACRDLDILVVIGAASPWSKDTYDPGVLPANVIVGSFSSTQLRWLYHNAAVVALAIQATERVCGMNVVAEGWAMHKPVVAASTGLRATISDAGGVVVPPGDIDGLRESIRALVEDSAAADRMGHRGWEYARDHLSLDRFMDVVARELPAASQRPESVPAPRPHRSDVADDTSDAR
jgi:glycosyltransferase involved in cell wall biosynthesis